MEAKYLRHAVIASILFLVLIPGAAAQEVRTGGNVVIAEGETVQGLTVTGGTVTVRGTVDGDLNVFAGDVEMEGNVTGNVNAFGGSILIAGNVEGNTSAYGGYVELADGGRIGGDLESAAGDAVINGAVGNEARIDAQRLIIGPTARIGGDLVHSTASLSLSNDADIGGDIRNVDRVNVAQGIPLQTNLPAWAFALYGFLIDLVLGVILLALLPGFSSRVAAAGRRRPIISIFIGILTAIIVPILLALLAITIIGLPIAIIGFFAFLLALWAGSVYGSYVIGTAFMRLLGVEGRWLGLFAGLIIVFLVGLIPFVGGPIVLLVTLMGLGALVSGVR